MRKRRMTKSVCPVCRKSISMAFGNYKRHLTKHMKCLVCDAPMTTTRFPRYGVCTKDDYHIEYLGYEIRHFEGRAKGGRNEL